MAGRSADPLPRLAAALVEVGARINEISAELRELHLAGPPPATWPSAPPQPQAPPAGWPQADAAQTPPAARPPADATPPQPPAAWAPADPAPLPQTPPAARPPADATPLPQTPPAGWPAADAAQTPPANWPQADAAQVSPAGRPPADPAAVPQTPPLGWPQAGPVPGPRPPGTGAPVPAWPAFPPPQPPAPAKPGFFEQEGAGSRVLAWAGGAVTLAGVVLLLVLAIQRGYLGPLPRVLSGAVLGLGLVGIGLRLHRSPAPRTGAFALAATGVAVLYLDVIAATALFGFLAPLAGLLAGLAVAGLGLLLAARWAAQPLAVFVVVCCACCAPFLTDGFVPLLLGFLLVLQIGATPVQLVRRWGWLCLASGVPAVLATLVTIALATGGRDDAATVAYLALVTSAVQVLVATVSGPEDERSAGLLLLAPAPAMLGAILLPKAGAVALPATIAVLLVAAWVLRRGTRFGHAAGAGASVALLQATATALDGSVLAIVLLAEALLLAVLAQRMRYPAALAAAALFGFAGLSVTLSTALPGDLVATPPQDPLSPGTVATAGLTGLLLAGSVLATCRIAGRLGVLSADTARPAWILGGLVALYGATGTVLSVGLLASPDRTGFLLGHVLVTVSWTVGALVLLLRGIESMPLRVAGLSLVGAALAKLVLFDLSSLDGMARVAAFLVAGLVLLAAGTRYARLVANETNRRHEQADAAGSP